MDPMELMDLASRTTAEGEALVKDRMTAEPAVIQGPATLRKFELPPDFKFDIGVQYFWDDDNALMDQVHDVVADLRVKAQAKALAKAKSTLQAGPIPLTAADEAALQARMDILSPYPTNSGPYPTNQGQKRRESRWSEKRPNRKADRSGQTENHNRPKAIPRNAIRWPESQWRSAAKKGGGPLTLEELITDNPIKSPDFDWRWYKVLWDWAMAVDGSMANGYKQETIAFTEEDFNMLCFAPRRILADTLPIIKDLPEQVEVHRGNSDMNWDPHLLALQFLYNDADLDKSDLATFKHHTCSELLTRYHALLTRIAAMNHRIVGHKDPDFGASLFLKEIQKNIGKNHERSKEVNHYNNEPDDFLADFEALRKVEAQKYENRMKNERPNMVVAKRARAREERIRIKGEERSPSKRVADDWDRFDVHGSRQSAHSKRMRQE